MKICEDELCTGCTACANSCPVHAITMLEDEKGFLRPVVDDSVCVQCGKCNKVCVANNQNKHEQKGQVYACWSLDLTKRRRSTSGGVFRLLAEKLLDAGGVVYGAAFDDSMHLVHKRAESQDALLELIGSKYVQSDLGDIFVQVKEDLKNERIVLFSGVACQIAALKNYLGKDYPNLFCVDVLCHGVPSPLVFKEYLKYMENRYKSKAKIVNFRFKKPNWTVFSMKIKFESGKTYVKSKFRDPFLYFFLVGGDLMLRPSCHQCKFTSPERVSDITLADFWKYKADTVKKYGTENGVNLVIVNTEKGNSLLNSISGEIFMEKSDWDAAIGSNASFIRPWVKPEKSDLFWDDFFKIPFEELVNKYCDKPGIGEFTALRRSIMNSYSFLGLQKGISLIKRLLRR